MTSTQQHRISGTRLRAATVALVIAAVVLIAAATLASHLAGASRTAGATDATPPPWTLTTLYSFTGGADGGYPQAGVIRDAAGNLYGTTTNGGTHSIGVVFKLDSSGGETVLHSFNVLDGGSPFAGLIHDAEGDVYGTSYGYSDRNYGTVFKLDPAGNETVLYSFTGGADGANPFAALIHDAAGNLYGTTTNGGNSNCGFGSSCGVVFELDKAGKETVLYTFAGGTDGWPPSSGLIRDAVGNLYGTTTWGGNTRCDPPYGCGVVYRLHSSGMLTVLHSFTGGLDGGHPSASLIHDAAGNLYGTTYGGGGGNCYDGCGVVFKLDSAGNETVLYTFTGLGPTPDGSHPSGNLFRDPAGNLYGTAKYGGNASCNRGEGCGAVFKVDPTGMETIIHTFTGGTDGEIPLGGLIYDAVSNLYGTALYGGAYGYGVVFKLTP